MKEFKWYAVLRDEQDDDLGEGSFNYDEAVNIASKYDSEHARIAVVSGWADSEEDAATNGLRDTEVKQVIPLKEEE